jgi:hypothetical protein
MWFIESRLFIERRTPITLYQIFYRSEQKSKLSSLSGKAENMRIFKSLDDPAVMTKLNSVIETVSPAMRMVAVKYGPQKKHIKSLRLERDAEGWFAEGPYGVVRFEHATYDPTARERQYIFYGTIFLNDEHSPG